MYDLILLNANVITMDPGCPEARCVLVRDGKIAGVGLRPPERARARNTIDLGGKTVLPGFIDAHCHIAALAEGLAMLDLSFSGGVDSMAALQEKVRDSCRARAPGAWVRGRGYDEFSLAEQRHPTRWDLDKAAPDHPVRLTHRSGHAHVLNSLAMRLAGITIESGDPPGGMIDRALGTGEPTGLLFGMGGYLSRRVPRTGEDEIECGVPAANERLVSHGITSVQDATAHNGAREWERFGRWKERGALGPRVTMMTGLTAFGERKSEARRAWIQGESLRTGPVKIVVGEVTGSLHPPQEELDRMVREIHEAGMQAAIHAIEENAIEAACSAVERALAASPVADHRHRIEHCSVCGPALARRIADLGMAVCTQPAFLYESGDRYLETVPAAQQRHLYPISTLAGSGIVVAFGSDAPIAAPDPLTGIRAAVDRTSAGGRTVLAREAVSIVDALRMHTADAARAAFEEGLKGSVTPGKLADLVVLNIDPRRADRAHLKGLAVDMTIIGGDIVWERGTGR